MDREKNYDELRQMGEPVDVAIIGGGATGLGAAVDGASRGFRVALFEQHDFAKGTSSRSTKLIHGGVRYLQQGNPTLVRDALRERGLLLKNAPHLVRSQQFVIPSYRRSDSLYYGLGLKLYDRLARGYRFKKSRHLSREATMRLVPTLRSRGLRGGTSYYDGAFDDARLAISLAQTADHHGALLLNYAAVTGFEKASNGRITAVIVRDAESGQTFGVPARVVINATGPFSDAVRRLDDPRADAHIAASQGAHLVLDASFLPGDAAVLIPRTEDGRVLFMIPWMGATLLGTTDTPVEQVPLEPTIQPQEWEFLLHTANRYLEQPVSPGDVRSVFVGIRPLVRSARTSVTSVLSRDHSIEVNKDSQLITILGGKWTTYRKMAEDVVDRAISVGGLPSVACRTQQLPLHGATASPHTGAWTVYGTDAQRLQALLHSQPELAARVHPDVSVSAVEVVWACRHEMARTVEDMLARRTRWLVRDPRTARLAAPAVAAIMRVELDRDAAWEVEQCQAFEQLASQYTRNPTHVASTETRSQA